MRVLTVLGTRPEIIKLSPLIPLLERDFNHVLVHSGQHHSYIVDGAFFEELNLPPAHYALEVGPGRHGEQIGRLLVALEDVLERERPDAVVVQGGANTALGGALAATKRGIPVAHVEAGCRLLHPSLEHSEGAGAQLTAPRLSNANELALSDAKAWEMSEEINQMLVDRCAWWLFAPDMNARRCLLAEGLPETRIYVTGSIGVDACLRNAPLAERRSTILERLRLMPGEYIFLSIHHAENTRPERLGHLLSAVRRLAAHYTLVFAAHPRTRAVLPAGVRWPAQVRLIEPPGYLDALHLTRHAKTVMTDSRSLQEQAATLGVPALFLRCESQAFGWMQPDAAGITGLVGVDEDEIVNRAHELLGASDRPVEGAEAQRTAPPRARHAGTKQRRAWAGAAQRIVEVLRRTLTDYNAAAPWLFKAAGIQPSI